MLVGAGRKDRNATPRPTRPRSARAARRHERERRSGASGHGRSVLVVGAGICGVTAAIELRRRGYAVRILDPGPLPHPDAASTDISKAIRMDYGSDELYTALMETAFPRWEEWNRRWPEPHYHPDGFLLMSRGAMEPGGFEHDSFELLRGRGHPLERVDSRTLEQRHPAWAAERYPDGYYNPRAGWADSGKVVARLLLEATAAGARLQEGARFSRLEEKGSRVTGVIMADGKVARANFVLIAAGAWTPTLLPHLSEVMWATGQPVLHFRPGNPSRYRPPRFPVWAADIANSGWYGFPARRDGTLKVGHHGRGRRVDPRERRVVGAGEEERFREFFRETFPGLADAPLVKSRLCLYCDTWDGNFWIDHDPDRKGLVVAAGDSGHGFKFAPVLGQLIADVLERRDHPFASRFAWRARGKIAHEAARFSEES